MSLIISIDGNIGSGKSTILKHLRERLFGNKNFVFVDEPIKEWGKITDNSITILEKFFFTVELLGILFALILKILCKFST